MTLAISRVMDPKGIPHGSTYTLTYLVLKCISKISNAKTDFI